MRPAALKTKTRKRSERSRTKNRRILKRKKKAKSRVRSGELLKNEKEDKRQSKKRRAL